MSTIKPKGYYAKQRKAKKKLLTEKDIAWSKEIKARARQRCEVCGSAFGVSAHHILTRRHLKTRHEADNGVALCSRHHTMAHDKPKQFVDIIIDIIQLKNGEKN